MKKRPNDPVALVDFLLHEAIAMRASDIHLEPEEKKLRIRYRIDGVLLEQDPVANEIAQQLCSRIKVLAQIDLSEKRLPQDGKFSLTSQDQVDLRVSTFPGLHGQKIVLRILDHAHNILSLEQLGMACQIADQFTKLLQKANGFFLVSGPTGSGKTTTLYSTLSYLHSPEKNIITLEDPVEYNVQGVTQGQVNPAIGFTFAQGLRSLLRQDPDIVMVGEIRDKETAQIAIEAALTGHIVLSTVHTNDAPSVIMRLMDMGIPSFLLNAAISGVMAQRLVRKLCTNCKIERNLTEEERQILKNKSIIKLFDATGCDECLQTGYKGRTGIFELLVPTTSLRAQIIAHPDFDHIKKQASKDGMISLFDDGMQKVQDGAISLEELLRVAA